MRDPGMGCASGADGERHSGHTSDAGRRALCFRTDRFADWPSGIRLSLAECQGCQRPGPAGRVIAPLNGRPGAGSSRTTRMARYLAAPASATRFSTGWHATSLTAPSTARHWPMQVMGAPVAPDPAHGPA